MDLVEDKAFRAKWWAVKQENKKRLAHYVETTLGYKINTDAMFDVQVKVSLSLLYMSIFSKRFNSASTNTNGRHSISLELST